MSEGEAPWVARALLGVYQRAISPALHAVSPSRCRYLPSCSEYAYVATARFGLMRGGALAAWRLMRCHPFSKGGLDPVPAAPADANHLP